MTAPRVEGEARLAEIAEKGDWLLPAGRVEQIRDRLMMDSTVGEAYAFPLSMASDLYREALYQGATVRSFARDLLDARSEIARLTAEVERLTKAVKLHADGLERAGLGYFAHSLRAALAAPTPAPEDQSDG